MESAICGNCGMIRTFSDEKGLPKKFCCSACGVLNTPQPNTTGTGDEACGCILPTSFEWKLPGGEIEGADGVIRFTTADDATGLTREEWIATFGRDPIVVRKRMKELGRKGKEGHVNLSTLNEIEEKIRGRNR